MLHQFGFGHVKVSQKDIEAHPHNAEYWTTMFPQVLVYDEDAKDEEKNPTGIVWMQIVNYRVVPDERREKAEFYVRTDHAGNHKWMSSKDMALGFMAAQVSSQLELCFEKVKSSFGTREAIKWVQLLIRDREELLKATQTLWSPYNVSAWW